MNGITRPGKVFDRKDASPAPTPVASTTAWRGRQCSISALPQHTVASAAVPSQILPEDQAGRPVRG